MQDENNCEISTNIDELENPSIMLPETIGGLKVEIEEQTYEEEDNLPLFMAKNWTEWLWMTFGLNKTVQAIADEVSWVCYLEKKGIGHRPFRSSRRNFDKL